MHDPLTHHDEDEARPQETRAERCEARMTPRRFRSNEPWDGHGPWLARWVRCAETAADRPPFVVAFRLKFVLSRPLEFRARVSADERYELFLDGARIGRGPERGDPAHWHFETYMCSLAAGAHVLVARVWALGRQSPLAQMSVAPGFLFAPEDDALAPQFATRHAGWEATVLGGYAFIDSGAAWRTGARIEVDGREFSWGFLMGNGDPWVPATVGRGAFDDVAGHHLAIDPLLTPATLPPMIDLPVPAPLLRFLAATNGGDVAGVPVRRGDHLAEEAEAWRDWLAGRGNVTIPAHTHRRAICELHAYTCAYHALTVSGGAGARIAVLWQESLWRDRAGTAKGNRAEIEGKFFIDPVTGRDGAGDVFRPDGGQSRRFESLWWHAGRFVELLVSTADAPLTLERFGLRETRYPLAQESRFAASDPRLASAGDIAWRTVQMCAHETYVDCPFYEQLMYAGDTRLQALVTYVATRDDRLVRKALRAFAWSRLPNGLTQSRYPCRERQTIAPFSLWWIGMLHDYARWRDGAGLVRALLRDMRGVLDVFLGWRDDAGLVSGMAGWNFLDWVPTWKQGVPPDGDGANASFNWQTVLALRQAAELEEWFGEAEMAARYRRAAGGIEAAIGRAFWDDGRGMFADDRARRCFSEHTQSLALIASEFGAELTAERQPRIIAGLLTAPDLARATVYFSHYLFEAYRVARAGGALMARLEPWFELPGLGLKTAFEGPEPARSDCHAWSAHPLFHYYATIAGIRPAAPGFARVAVEPLEVGLAEVTATMVHPRGEIIVGWRRSATGAPGGGGGALTGRVTLPEGVSGVFRAGGIVRELRSGRNEIGS